MRGDKSEKAFEAIKIQAGYEPTRFNNLGDFAEDLTCPICSGIVRDPVSTACRHLFCKQCIEQWLNQTKTCPVDRKPVNRLHRPPLMVTSMFRKLKMSCDYASQGCPMFVALEFFDDHVRRCQFRPKDETGETSTETLASSNENLVVTTRI